MTMTAAGPFWCPQVTYGPTSAVPSFAIQSVLSVSGRMSGYVLQAPKTGSIRKIHFRTGSLTTATDTDVRIETVDSSTGNPTGTLWATNTNITVASASLAANTWITTGALTADASVTQGDIFSVVLAPTGSPNYNIAGFTVGTTGVRFPYGDDFTGGAWVKSTGVIPVVGIEYSDGTFADMPEVFPISGINGHTFNNGSTPDEYALKFRFPVPVSVAGFWLWADQDGDFDAVLYDSDGTTPLMTISFDKDTRQGTGVGHHFFRFDASVSLAADTFYRLAIKPSSATSLSVYSMDAATAALFDQMPGGQNFHHSTRTDAGSWTDTTTRRLFIGLMIDGVDDGAGGGGGTSAYPFIS